MRILITGGAGFLGLHLAKFFTKKKTKVLLLDINDFATEEYPAGCRFIKANIRDREAMVSYLAGCDVVIHAAAALPLSSAKTIFAVNVSGTKNLLDASLKNRVKHFIFISSTAVYGVPEKHPILESDPVHGVGPYGESKIRAERLCSAYRKKKLLVTVIRPKTFIGTHRLGVFEILFDWIKDGKKIPVIGSGNNRYQLLDVDDLVESVYLIATSKNRKSVNTEFNIGAEKFDTVKADLTALFQYARSGSRILPTPAFFVKKALWFFEKIKLSPLYMWVYETADKDSYVSIKRLIEVLGWKPRFSNAQALIKAYKWYEAHYKEIKSRPAGITHTVGWKQGILGFFKRFL